MGDEEKCVFVPKTAMDFQKLKLDRLMKNPDKPIFIPEMPKEKKNHNPPEFVRNVMGSSAGAGSGEFHVYRHLRRKEYTRQKNIEEKALKDEVEGDYHKKIEENKRKMEERTAKKRAKRLKRKMRLKQRKTEKVSQDKESKEMTDSENSEEESEAENKK